MHNIRLLLRILKYVIPPSVYRRRGSCQRALMDRRPLVVSCLPSSLSLFFIFTLAWYYRLTLTAEDDKPVTANHQASVKTASPTFRERGSGYVSPSTEIMNVDKDHHLYTRVPQGLVCSGFTDSVIGRVFFVLVRLGLMVRRDKNLISVLLPLRMGDEECDWGRLRPRADQITGPLNPCRWA